MPAPSLFVTVFTLSFLVFNAVSFGVDSIFSLRARIHAGKTNASRSVGFLSEGNFGAVADLLPNTTVPRYFSDMKALEEAVRNEVVIAALATSAPLQRSDLNIFTTGRVSARGMLMSSSASASLRSALDWAVSSFIASGDNFKIEDRYFEQYGYDTVTVLDCPTSADVAVYPTASPSSLLGNRTTLRVGALGPSNWGYSGNYEVDPPVGFWPEVMESIWKHLVARYPTVKSYSRVYYATSAEVMNALANGTIDVTEPYWTKAGVHGGVARQLQFQWGCTSLGTDDVFFSTSFDSTKVILSKGAVAGIVIAVVGVIASLIAFIIVMGCKERLGRPLFYSAISKEEPPTVEMH